MLSYTSSVTNFSSSKYVQHGGPNGGAAPAQAGQGFPQHYYPSPHEKSQQQQQLPAGRPDPNSKLRTELSPRQADAVERHAPQRIANAAPKSTTTTILPQTGRSVPIKVQQAPALKLAQGKVHQFPSEQRAAAQQSGGNMPVPTKTAIIKGPATVNVNMTAISPSAPENYKELVAAPTPPKSYGNYPELTNQAQQKPYSLPVKPVQTVSAPPPKPARAPTQPYIYEEQPNATMETKVAGQGQPKRVGRWTLSQLRQTDGIVPSQAGWNKGDSQKLMTNFGTPRNTSTRVKSENLQEIPEDVANRSHGEVRLQSGTNKYASQKGSTGFGAPRDVCREGVRVSQNPADLPELSEEKIRMSEGIVRLQAGTNKYDSQKVRII
ncbi:hypothetical protein WR25_11573 [Diploscapter pachys]|uniref:Uncharacterized protein n=1 Tax=Diploscapter pachys TaxID=2018661 RepID=A0A2A2JQ37_9BILA|nr:hypothetical protein WR25_11573 [Diploscapter pachys]